MNHLNPNDPKAVQESQNVAEAITSVVRSVLEKTIPDLTGDKDGMLEISQQQLHEAVAKAAVGGFLEGLARGKSKSYHFVGAPADTDAIPPPPISYRNKSKKSRLGRFIDRIALNWG